MRRGDVVIAAVPGDYGKPRPAVVVQADDFAALASLTIAPLTSELHDTPLLRIAVEPTDENGLRKPSQVMVDKISTVSRSRIAQRVGLLDRATMQRVNQSLAAFLGLNDAGT